MAFRPYPLIVAISLVQAFGACAPASGPSLDHRATADDNPVVAAEPATSPTPAPSDAVVPTNDFVRLVGDQRQLDERFFRPLLPIDGAGHVPTSLPDGAKVSYIVVDLDRGTTIAQHHADRLHIPASSAKLATAVLAMERLGPDHRFKTELRTTGPIEEGILKGDLVLHGGGDPTLDIPDLLPLIDALSRQPLRRIEGRFLIDDSLLPRLTEIEPTQPTEAGYNPGVSALSIAFNRVNIRWQKRGNLSVETVPRLHEASFEHAATDLLPPGGVQLKQFDGQHAVWQLADRGARRSKRSLPVKDPGLYAGQVFKDLARLHGIELPAPMRASQSLEGRLLAVHESRPLRELVRDMLWYSNNLVAELIGLATARTVDPGPADLGASAGTVLSTLAAQLSDISWDGARLDNHSGLSSQSRLTPAQLAALLRSGWTDGQLFSALPGSGWSGTLARRFNTSDQAFRIWAKTGSMNYAATLGGYLLSPSHGPAAFAIMISDEKARAIYDTLPRRTRDSERRAHLWKKKAETAMNVIVERWLQPTDLRPGDSSQLALSSVPQKTSP